MVLCGILMFLVLLNLIARATNNKSYVGCKIASILFFVCMLIATIMMVVYAAKDNSISNVIDSIKEGAPVVSIGYGLIVSLGCSLLTVIFSPMKKK